MSPIAVAIEIKGLAEFRRDVRRAEAANPRLTTLALKAAAVPIIARARATMPSVSGDLQKGLKSSVRGTVGKIVSNVPYAGGSEWGMRGKWEGWVSRYGPKPRFVYPAVEASAPEVMEILDRELRDVIRIYGWAV